MFTVRLKGDGRSHDSLRMLCGASVNCTGQLGTVENRDGQSGWCLMLGATYHRVQCDEHNEAWAPSVWAMKRQSARPRRPRRYSTGDMRIWRDANGQPVMQWGHGTCPAPEPWQPERDLLTGRLMYKSAPELTPPYWKDDTVSIACPRCHRFSMLDWNEVERRFARLLAG